jgi:hypothetical protein
VHESSKDHTTNELTELNSEAAINYLWSLRASTSVGNKPASVYVLLCARHCVYQEEERTEKKHD